MSTTEHASDPRNSQPRQIGRGREAEEEIGTNTQESQGEETEARNGHKHLSVSDSTVDKVF